MRVCYGCAKIPLTLQSLSLVRDRQDRRPVQLGGVAYSGDEPSISATFDSLLLDTHFHGYPWMWLVIPNLKIFRFPSIYTPTKVSPNYNVREVTWLPFQLHS